MYCASRFKGNLFFFYLLLMFSRGLVLYLDICPIIFTRQLLLCFTPLTSIDVYYLDMTQELPLLVTVQIGRRYDTKNY